MSVPLTPVGEVTYWLSGGTPKRSVAEYWSGEVPWISASTLKTSEISESDQHLTTDAVARASKMAPLGSTLLLVRGSALYNEIRAGLVIAPVCFNQDVKALVPRPGLVPKFLTYSLLGRAPDLLRLVSTAGNSAGVLDTKLVQAFEIFFPSAQEQRAIAEALSDVDGLLGALDALIAKKRARKQAAIQQLLTGKTRLPGFSGEWEIKPLAEVCTLKSGASITSARIDSHSAYPCYGGNGCRGFTSTFTHDGEHALIGRQGALCGNVVGVSGKFYASEHALVVTPSETTDIRWLTFLLGRMQLNQYSESSAQPGLSAAKLLLLEISCPPTKAEQTAIASILSDMDAEIAALEARRDKTRAIKQGIMQQLLSGRVRLVKPEQPSAA